MMTTIEAQDEELARLLAILNLTEALSASDLPQVRMLAARIDALIRSLLESVVTAG